MRLLDIEAKIGFAPNIYPSGPNGRVLECLLDDGKVLIMAPISTDNLIADAVVWAYQTPTDRKPQRG